MAVVLGDLESYLNSLGDAVVMIGSVTVADGLAELGAKEGDVSISFNQEFNELKFGEVSGPATYEASLQGEDPTITIPLIISNPALWAKLSPTGATGGGSTRRVPVVPTSMVIIPDKDLIAAAPGGYAKPIDPGVWTPSAPENWVWFWRVYFQFPDLTFRNPDGQKSITSVVVKVLMDKTKEEGFMQYLIGDPAAEGISVVI